MIQGCHKAQAPALLTVDWSSKSAAQRSMVSTEVAKLASKWEELTP